MHGQNHIKDVTKLVSKQLRPDMSDNGKLGSQVFGMW